MRKIILLLIVALLAFASCSTKTDRTIKADESMKMGLNHFKNRNYDKAITMFENTLMEAENPEMAAKAQLFLADSYFLDKKYAEAIPAYELFIEIYGETDDAVTALLRLGLSHYALIDTIDRDMGAVEGALYAFTQLRDISPSSAREFEVNKKIVELRSLLAERELYVAKFYFRIKEPDSAEGRLLYLINNYEDTEAYGEALYLYANWLADKEGREAEAVKYYQKLIKERPDSPYVLDVARELTSLLAKITVKLEETKEN
ncbi:MAG: hypothetical protein C0602_00860 [Denitrovibrio sp.]|nr:MAG: hypothetical protein C0602_00860 [Denitrovibrio sp.]